MTRNFRDERKEAVREIVRSEIDDHLRGGSTMKIQCAVSILKAEQIDEIQFQTVIIRKHWGFIYGFPEN
jgi:hypothetical protein